MSRTRIVWSESEEQLMLKRAVAIQLANPSLAGLALLREAMVVLPPERRRKLMAITQAPWFIEGMVQAKHMKQREDDPYMPYLITITASLRRIEDLLKDR